MLKTERIAIKYFGSYNFLEHNIILIVRGLPVIKCFIMFVPGYNPINVLHFLSGSLPKILIFLQPLATFYTFLSKYLHLPLTVNFFFFQEVRQYTTFPPFTTDLQLVEMSNRPTQYNGDYCLKITLTATYNSVFKIIFESNV